MTLRLDHLHIKNYRCFEELHIPQFKQINLIAGKNNVGKTALLEAIRIWASEGDSYVVNHILTLRQENDLKKKYSGYESYFNETIEYKEDDKIIATLSINEVLLVLNGRREKNIGSSRENMNGNAIYYPYIKKDKYLDRNLFFVSSDLSFSNLDLWEDIDLSYKKDYVIDALNLVLNGVGDVGVYKNDFVKILQIGDSEAKSLKQFGDGMSRIFSLTLALVSAENSILLIDEFENGLHHSVQEKIWEFIFQMAKKLNVQVIATTHSRDTVAAFGKESAKNEGKGQYLRLEKDKSGRIKPVLYSQEELETAIDLSIETR